MYFVMLHSSIPLPEEQKGGILGLSSGEYITPYRYRRNGLKACVDLRCVFTKLLIFKLTLFSRPLFLFIVNEP